MTDTFTYWADNLDRAHNFTAGCYCAGFEGSGDPAVFVAEFEGDILELEALRQSC